MAAQLEAASPHRATEIKRARSLVLPDMPQRFAHASRRKSASRSRLGQKRANLFSRAVMEQKILLHRRIRLVKSGAHRFYFPFTIRSRNLASPH
jgi:hypothetical protein